MKKLFLRALLILIPFLYSIYVSSQPRKARDCSTTCFSSEVVSVQKISESCSSYELKVAFASDCAHALSHFTVGVPCGQIEKIWNSEGWPSVVGTDPTTGLTGFKIDDISGFGETSLQHFTVKFNVCASGESCSKELACWQPQVAYKASTCVNYETLAVSCQNLKAYLVKQDASCFGAQDGSLSVMIEEGVDPYTFLWSDNSTLDSIGGLAAGIYSVIITDASGSELVLQDTIAEPARLLPSAVITPASCNGIADGSIDLSVFGGAGEYQFLWSNGQTTEDIEGLSSGTYIVKVTDAGNCSVSKSFTIANTSTIRVSSIQVKPDCNDTNGEIDITVSGGTSPYSFQWSNGATTEDVQDIGAGLYSVVVTDQSGCTGKVMFLLKENNTLNLTGTTTPTSCTDDASGSIDISVSGGTPPYIYSWNSGETTEDLTNLNAGYYTVVVTDAKGCTVTSGFRVSKKSFQVSRTVIQPSCYGTDDGSITLYEPVGGTAPYTYTWSNGETGTMLAGLSPGVYSVTITDATGCSRTLTTTIAYPAQIEASATVTNANCEGDGFYSIDLTLSGGTSPYTFLWSNGSTTEDLQGLTTGTYTVTITDTQGCTLLLDVVVAGESIPWSCLIDPLASVPVCGSANNELSTSVSGADSYVWSVESTDGAWSISASDTSAILFTAGGANSSATFTLTIEKDGCTKSCSYSITSCTEDADGGTSDPEAGDPVGSEPGSGGEETDDDSTSCEECFQTSATVLEDSGGCRTYEMIVSTNGLCRYELSHWTLDIPCGTVSDYSNSEGWPMEVGQDPTTGLYGLKVDEISAFGKTAESFTVRFKVCHTAACGTGWTPLVAYKGGQCIARDSVEILQETSAFASVSVYPNPFEDRIRFEWSSSNDEVNLKVLDQYGTVIWNANAANGKDDSGYYITLPGAALPKGIYYYLLMVDGNIASGKISKR